MQPNNINCSVNGGVDFRLAMINMIFSALMFAIAGVIVKALSDTMDIWSILFWRNLFGFLSVIIIALVLKDLQFKSSRKRLHALRSFFTFMALVTYFYALANTTLGTAVLLQQSAPIFVPIIALIFFKKLSDRYVWVGSVVGFIGVALTTGLFFNAANCGDLIGLISGLMGGAATVTIWAMSSTETPLRQMLFFSLYTFIYSCFLIPYVWKALSLSVMPYLVLLGVVTTAAQYFLSSACAMAPTDKIASWSYLSVVFAVIFGYFGWGEKISFVVVMGMALIVFGAGMSQRTRIY